MPMTPAERQQRRRDKLAALRPPAGPTLADPLETRKTRQETWDSACETLQIMLETYRHWRALTPAPAAALRPVDLPRLSAQALTLALVSFPDPFAQDWDWPIEPAPAGRLDPRTLIEQLVSDQPGTDVDAFPRTAEDDAAGRAWWQRIPEDARSTWISMARSADPADIWHIVRRRMTSIT